MSLLIMYFLFVFLLSWVFWFSLVLFFNFCNLFSWGLFLQFNFLKNIGFIESFTEDDLNNEIASEISIEENCYGDGMFTYKLHDDVCTHVFVL